MPANFVLTDWASLEPYFKNLSQREINSKADLEKWLKADAETTLPPLERAELRGNRDQSLRLTREELMRHGAEAITEEQFPKTLKLGDFEVPVTYRFEPGHVMDGVTAKLPLALLNAVEDRYASWLIPGLFREKISAYFKALPKAERGRVQPVPDSVTNFLELATPREKPLAEAMLVFLRDWATQERFTYSHTWQVGDAVMWDNTGSLHRATVYPADSIRMLHRTKLEGEEPIV